VRSAFISGSIIIFSLVVGVPISMDAEAVKMMSGVSPDGLFTLAQTGGMMRRQDRRDARRLGGSLLGTVGCWLCAGPGDNRRA
jgi:hypothetical protein